MKALSTNGSKSDEKFDKFFHLRHDTVDLALFKIVSPTNITIDGADLSDLSDKVVSALVSCGVKICYPMYVGSEQIPCSELSACPFGCVSCLYKNNH